MATLAQLGVIFTVDNSQFKAGLRDSEKEAKKSSSTIVGDLKKIGSGLRGGINAVFSFQTALATLAGSAGIGLLIKNEMAAIDETNKFARILGLSTENLISYRHGAEMAGVETSTFDSSMTALIKRLGEARAGTGPMISFFQKYDKTILENIQNQQNASGALAIVADAIKNARTEADAAAIANAAFSRQGVKMAEVFRKDGAEALKMSREEAERLGITFSAFDASLVEEASDAIERMQKSFKATTTHLTIRLAPILTAVADQITDMNVRSRGMFDAFGVGGKIALGVIKALADGFHTIGIGIQGIRVIALGLMALVTNIAVLWMNSWGKVIDFVTSGLNKLIEKANEIPGVNIPLFGKINGSEVQKQIEEIAANSIGALEEAKIEFQRMMLEPLPSQAIDDFIRQVEEKLVKLRESQASTITSSVGGKDPVNEMNAEQKRQLESIRNDAKTELQIEMEKFEQKRALIQSFRDQNFITEAENKILLEDLEQKHQDKLAEIQSAGQSQMLGQYTSFLKKMELGAKQSGAAQLNTVTGALADLTAAGATQNKKMFKLNKIAGISNAIVSTYQGMSKALEWGWPMGPIFAGLIGAAGFANVQAIRSQSFGGGGGVAPSVVPTPAPPVTPVSALEQPGQQVQQRTVNVTISGPVDRQYLKDALLPALQEEIDENDVTFIGANSAQARELARANG